MTLFCNLFMERLSYFPQLLLVTSDHEKKTSGFDGAGIFTGRPANNVKTLKASYIIHDSYFHIHNVSPKKLNKN